MKNAFLSKKCSLELSRTHIPSAIFATWRARSPKVEILLKSRIWAQYTFWEAESDFDAKIKFGVRMRCRVVMSRMLMKTIDFLIKWRPSRPKVNFDPTVCFGPQNQFLDPKIEK